MSAVQVQHVAHKAYLDEAELLDRLKMSREHALKSIRSLASLGPPGRLPGNCTKELMNLLSTPAMPHPRAFKLITKIEKPGPRMLALDLNTYHGFSLPHVIFLTCTRLSVLHF